MGQWRTQRPAAPVRCWDINTGELLPQPPKKQRAPDLTAGERRALTILSTQAAEVVKPGHVVDRLAVTYVIAEQLVIRGYARPEGDLVVITQAGRGALAQPAETDARLLAPAARPAHTELGYTDLPGAAMRDEPEAVTEAEQKRITDHAHAVSLARKGNLQKELNALTLDKRLLLLEAARAQRRIDVTRELRGIAHAVAEAERIMGLAA
jgi:hypothetical protein